ncbi:MAG TPA: hypothetical protein VGB76_11170 [Pyrinomonadaceae bacterium]|jgi:hypothetical protein
MAATIKAFVVALKPRDVAAAARGDEDVRMLVEADEAAPVVSAVTPVYDVSAFDSTVAVVVALRSSFEAVSPGHCCPAAFEVSFAVSVVSSAPQPGQVC